MRPRLLFLSQTLPYPPDGGRNIRTFNVLRLLAQAFDITALCFYRVTDRGDPTQGLEESVGALSRFGIIEAFPIPQEHSRSRMLWDHFRSTVRRRAYTFYAYESSQFEARLTSVLQSCAFDLVHMDSLDLAPYLPLVGANRVVCVHHNVESALLRSRSRAEQLAWRRLYIRFQAGLLQKLEREWCARVAMNVVVSPADATTLAKIVPQASITVVPNGVDIETFRPEPGRGESGIVCVGGLTWFPNRNGLEFFCDRILPQIRREQPGVRVRWVGRASLDERAAFERRGVELTGYVSDVRPYVQQAACYVVPLRAGGGTRLKILDAWAMGKAVVSTSIGCEGLAAVDGVNILIRDEPDEFARAVLAVLGNGDLRRRLGEGGRRTAEVSYSWQAIGGPMLKRYRALSRQISATTVEPEEESSAPATTDPDALPSRSTDVLSDPRGESSER